MIIVTGGAGFIGSNIVKGLNERGINDILIVDNLSTAIKHKNLNKLRFADYIDKYDFNVDEYLRTYDVEAIFHQGASSNTMETDGKYMMTNNYEYTKNIFNACQKYGVRLFYASSASVYGNGENGFREEETCEYPLNVYAFSKYQFDRYFNNYYKRLEKEYYEKVSYLPESFRSEKQYSFSLGAQVVGLRYFNVYGPQENHKGKMASVAYHMYHQVKKGENMKLFEGSENFIRDFIHVDDVVSVNMFFFDNPHISGIFNCGTGKAESFCRIADAMKERYKDAKLEFVPFPENLVGKYQTFTQSDITKLRSVGYNKPFVDLKIGTLKYIDVLENSQGYII